MSYFDISKRVIVVTGAGGKIGREISKALVSAGASVVALDLAAPKDLDGCFALRADVTDRKQLESVLRTVEQRWETPYGLVNAAAIDSPPDAPPSENGPFEDYPEDSWDRIMAVNVKGVLLCSQVFGGAMAKRGSGSIVNVASIYGMVSPDQALYQYRRDRGEVFYKPVAYAASKSALYNLTRYMAAYWGDCGVRVNAVTFGGVFSNQDPEFLSGYEAKVPLRRMAHANEYNGVVHFLLSDAASYMTGSNVVVDGGFTAL